MLRSSKNMYLRISKAPEISDLEHRERLQLRLQTLCRRSLALCVGRGMLTSSSLSQCAMLAELLPMPPLVLTGRMPPQNTIISLDGQANYADFTYCEFK